MKSVGRWLLLAVVSIGLTVPLARLDVPSAALFAALVVGIGLALASLAPRGVPRPLGLAAQGVLGVYIGTMVYREAFTALGSHWPIVVAVVVGTLLISIAGGALLGLHRDVSPLTGALALTAGGASGLVAIARELGGDERTVAVVQYLRVGLITASMPVVVALIYHADTSGAAAPIGQQGTAPWYVSIPMLAAIVVVGALLGRLVKMPGSGLLGPMAITMTLELTGLSFGLAVPVLLVQLGYLLIGWQAGLSFTPAAIRTIRRVLPAAIGLIVALNVATAGLGVLLAHVAGLTPIEGYLATSPGGVYAVLATAVETNSNVTFIIGAQVCRIVLMLFTAPLLARAFKRLGQRRADSSASSAPIRSAEARPAASTSS